MPCPALLSRRSGVRPGGGREREVGRNEETRGMVGVTCWSRILESKGKEI